MNPQANTHSFLAVFKIFLRLGFTSFGGPIAHLAYFRDEFVVRQGWLSEQDYAGIVSLCQFLPGPASSQVGLIIGLRRGGHLGALAAWLGFTLPSAMILIIVALGLTRIGASDISDLVHSLKVVAVAIVAQAVWGMAKALCYDLRRGLIMVSAAAIVFCYPFVVGQLGAIVISGLTGFCLLTSLSESQPSHYLVRINKSLGVCYLVLFLLLLFGLPALSQWSPSQDVVLFSSFYQAGSLVFGGGHVVLPLLQAEVVVPGYVTNETFLAGYGAAQAVPGPLFTFAAFLGALIETSITGVTLGWYGGALCLLAIFLPSFLLVTGVLPFWDVVHGNPRIQSALAGINAGVVGLLLAVLYNPLATSTIKSFSDVVWILIAFLALTAWEKPSWLIVLGCVLIGLVTMLLR